MHLQELTVGSFHASDTVPSLVHLTQLKSLRLVGTVCRPDSFPTSLQQLHLHAMKSTPYAMRLRFESLMQLTSLEIREMLFKLAETVTCLQNLQTLSLQGSDIWASPAPLLKLTWLTCLNLSGSFWFVNDPGDSDAFAIFRAWPLLQVLKVDNCNLFEATTSFEAPRVQDLQVSWVREKEPKFTSQARWRIVNPTTMQSPISDYCCLQYLTALQITADRRADALFYAEVLRQALSNFQFLESLSLNSMGTGCDGAAEIVVTSKQGQTLKKLELGGFPCSTLDLRCAARLTCLDLSCRPYMRICARPDFVMHLPASLVICTFVDTAVSMPAARLIFEPCKHLTKLCLGVAFRPDVELPYTLPVLPSGLCQLAMRSIWSHKSFLDCDWHCLDACSNLQHLSLPSSGYLCDYLKIWVESARCLHIVDFENELSYHSYKDQL